MKLKTYLALSINTNIIRFVIATCSIDYFSFVAIVKTFTMWHTIQFTWIWCFQIRDPFISSTLKRSFVKIWTLLMSKVWFIFWAILFWKIFIANNKIVHFHFHNRKGANIYLRIARKILLVATWAPRSSTRTVIIRQPKRKNHCNTHLWWSTSKIMKMLLTQHSSIDVFDMIHLHHKI